MKIETYIEQLLYRYQCVTIPEFGAFLTEIQSAQLDANSNLFFPPKKLISFSQNAENDDDLLANHIAVTEKISYEFAVDTIQNEILIWKKELDDNGYLSIKNIGQILINADKNLMFFPNNRNTYLTTSFGLNSLISPKVKRQYSENQPEETLGSKTTQEVRMNQEEESNPYQEVRMNQGEESNPYQEVQINQKEESNPYQEVQMNQKEESNSYQEVQMNQEEESNPYQEVRMNHEKESNSYLKYVAIFIIAAGIAASVGYQMYENRITIQTVLVETAVQKQVQNKIQEATFFIKNPISTTFSVEEEKLPMVYHVVEGAHRTEKDARKKCLELKKMGYDDAKMIPANEHGLFPVLYGSYPTMREAEKAEKEIQHTINPAAWILIETL